MRALSQDHWNVHCFHVLQSLTRSPPVALLSTNLQQPLIYCKVLQNHKQLLENQVFEDNGKLFTTESPSQYIRPDDNQVAGASVYHTYYTA